MTKIKSIRSTAVCVALVTSAMMFSQVPAHNVDARKHPTLASAQESIVQADQKIEQAQRGNKDQLGGHAQKARDLLVQASQELKQAADYADHRK